MTHTIQGLLRDIISAQDNVTHINENDGNTHELSLAIAKRDALIDTATELYELKRDESDHRKRLLTNIFNGVYTACKMGKVKAEWQQHGHTNELSSTKAIESLQRDYDPLYIPMVNIYKELKTA